MNKELSSFEIDVSEKKKHAARSMELGGVVDPGLSATVVEALQPLLATEQVAALRYRSQALLARGVMSEKVVEEFLEHANDESTHAHQLAERIAILGGVPQMGPKSMLEMSYVEYKDEQSLGEMVKENLSAERTVIQVYRKMVQWIGHYDPTTRRLLEDILAQEEEHADDLAALLPIADLDVSSLKLNTQSLRVASN